MMPSHHRILIMALLLVIGVTGPYAIADSVHLGADAKPVKLTAQELAVRTAAVKASQRSIHHALSAQVPPLPETPVFTPLGEPRLGPLVVIRVTPASPTKKAPAMPVRRPTKKKVATPVSTPPPAAAADPSTASAPAPTAPAATPPAMTPAPRRRTEPKCEVHDDGSVECQAPEIHGPGG